MADCDKHIGLGVTNTYGLCEALSSWQARSNKSSAAHSILWRLGNFLPSSIKNPKLARISNWLKLAMTLRLDVQHMAHIMFIVRG